VRAAQFDVPKAMHHIYLGLERLGFKPRITIAPSEWDNNEGAWVRFLHVHGDLEVTFRPFGKKEKDHERKWRISKADNSLATFTGWQDGVLATIRMSSTDE
jgi:hypothetical protein